MTERAAEDLIPKSVRRVLIDTVGGDGLYVVREIADLLELEGFERGVLVEPETGGSRRQEAEMYQATIGRRGGVVASSRARSGGRSRVPGTRHRGR